MITYYIYFIFLAIFAIEYELNKFEKKWPLIFVAILLALLAGLRGENVSRDYLLYKFAFDNIKDFINNGSGIYFGIYEPGFIGIVLLFKSFFTVNYGMAIMLFFAFASIAMKVFAFNRFSFNPFLVILLYYSHYFMIQEMTQIRIGLASAIFLVSLIFYFQNNYKAFVAMILFATLFHYSAILYLAVLLLNKEKFNISFYSILLILSVILGFLKLPLFNFVGDLFSFINQPGKLETYGNIIQYSMDDNVKVFNIINLIRIICSVYLLYMLRDHYLRKDTKVTFFLKCNIIAIFTLSLFSGVPLIDFRLSDLFAIPAVISFSYLTKFMPFSKFNIWFVIIIAGLFFYVNVIYGGLLEPYHLIKPR